MASRLTAQLFSKTLRQNVSQKRLFRSRPEAEITRKLKVYQMDNELPVYLKGGFGDRALFVVTCGLVVVGVCLSYGTLVMMAMPKKKS
ncbi:cytochrome c oxidase subunit 7A1, mitochondrial [Aethina tumida]|uniref:cytochrome c oxidase subunit 7A1, mitochondrial n=1 Tax=Aethina tumida TaxID=116153 RepID=UPI00096B5958|nr:cytochrome c oxidase subunit 7A1, mitochondrial [Aethina tumida]